jgi:hypothetical protein
MMSIPVEKFIRAFVAIVQDAHEDGMSGSAELDVSGLLRPHELAVWPGAQICTQVYEGDRRPQALVTVTVQICDTTILSVAQREPTAEEIEQLGKSRGCAVSRRAA